MATNKKNNARDKILNSGWKLFLEQGYEETTVNQIIQSSKTSRGAFYHHFHGKEEILFCIAYYFDNSYINWVNNVDKDLSALDKLLDFNQFVMDGLENSEYRPLLATLYGLQVKTKGVRHILNPDRIYYKIINGILKEGLDNKEIKSEYSIPELLEMYTILERGLTYDWCLNQGRYSISKYGKLLISNFIETIKV